MIEVSSFFQTAAKHNLKLKRNVLETLQVNIGKLCNQACLHCHVEAGPNRRENMELKTIDRLLELLANNKTIKTVDITGGAPELNAHFTYFVSEIRKLSRQVIDRCNLTVLFEPGQESTAEFLAKNEVWIVASLPCYSKENVEKQRGRGTFNKSIEGLKLLNTLGYGKKSTLKLDLVYNPLGAFLPPAQKYLEATYKKELKEFFDIEFDRLLTITNMPIKRFRTDLIRNNKLEHYMNLLFESFNPTAAEDIMCRSLVSVGYDGKLYDCDFNQMLEMPLAGKNQTIWDIQQFEELINRPVVVADHCYGCTAGAGSSCQGALAQKKNIGGHDGIRN